MKGQYRLPLLLSLALHGALAILLLANIEFEKKKIVPKPVPEVVQATVIDESKVRAELEKLKQQEIDKRQSEKAEQNRLKKAQEKEKRRLADLKQKRLKEQKRAKELAAKNKEREKAEANRIAKLKKAKEAENKRLAKLKKERLLAEKKLKAAAEKRKKVEAEKRRKAEIARKEKIAKKKAAALAEKKRKEKAEKERKARELALKKQLAAEKRAQQAVASYRDVIRQKIQRSWLKPATSSAGLSCKIRVKLIPGGSVMDATVVKSSGDSLFDRSVEVAVLKASPLPIPEDPTLFSYFRTLDLNFNPKE